MHDRRAVLSTATLLVVVGCAGTQFTMIGPARPAREEGCDLTLLPGRQPDFPTVDIATVQAWCQIPTSRSVCIDELRKRACALGGDVVYSFSESVNDQSNYVSATVAYRDTSRLPHPPQVAVASPGGCAPPCSPGFACKSGACIPQCNPACEAGELCNRHRTCEPTSTAARAPAAPPPSPPPTPAPSAHP